MRKVISGSEKARCQMPGGANGASPLQPNCTQSVGAVLMPPLDELPGSAAKHPDQERHAERHRAALRRDSNRPGSWQDSPKDIGGNHQEDGGNQARDAASEDAGEPATVAAVRSVVHAR